MTKKQGLKVRDVSKEHFSSGVNVNEPKFSRIVIRIIECKQLLASDVETGKSDPVCFVWCGFNHEHPTIQELTKKGGQQDQERTEKDAAIINGDEEDKNVLHTSVCYTTTDPIWNEDVIFPVDPEEVDQLSNMKIIIYVRDEDRDEYENITYDELGQLEVQLSDVIVKGKALQGSIVLPAAWYKLEKSPGMRRIDGTIKLTISIILAPEDNDILLKRLQSPEPSLLQTRAMGPGQLLQYTVKNKLQQIELGDDTSVRGSLSGLPRRPGSANSPSRLSSGDSVMSSSSRPNSASKRRAASKQDASKNRIGSMIRRPPSARGRPDDISVLSEEREGEDDGDELVIIPKEKELELRERNQVSSAQGNKNYLNQSEQKLPLADSHDDLFSFAPEKVLVEDQDNVLLKSGPPMADQSFLDEMIRMGIESAGNVIDKMDLGDVAQDAVLHVAQAAATKAKKWVDPAVQETVAGVKVHGSAIVKTIGEKLVESVIPDYSPRQQLASTLPVIGDISSRTEHDIEQNLKFPTSGSTGAKPTAGASMNATHPSWKKKKQIQPDQEDVVDDEYGDHLLMSGPQIGDQLINPEEEEDPKGQISGGYPDHANSVVESLSKEIDNTVSTAHRNVHPHQDYASQREEQIAAYAAGGGGIAAVRVIRTELQYQREFIKKTLFAIAKSTDNGFQRVSTRLETLEGEVQKQKPCPVDSLLDGPRYGGDENLPDEDEKLRKSRSNATSGTKSTARSRSKERLDPGRSHDDDRISSSPKSKRPNSGGRNHKSSSARSASGLKNYIKQSRQQNPVENFTSSFGGSGINQVPQQKDIPVQFVFRGDNGNISSAVIAPPQVPSDMFMQVPIGDQAGLPPTDGYNVRNTRMTADTNGMRGSGYNYAFSADSPAKNPLLNKDFNEVLQNGSLDDISNMLESCAAKPDHLAASTRNRLFDIVSTLLMRGKKVERPMLWVTNLLTSPDLFYQLAPHTQNDIISGLKNVADMPNNSGMLAILLLKKIRTMES